MKNLVREQYQIKDEQEIELQKFQNQISVESDEAKDLIESIVPPKEIWYVIKWAMLVAQRGEVETEEFTWESIMKLLDN